MAGLFIDVVVDDFDGSGYAGIAVRGSMEPTCATMLYDSGVAGFRGVIDLGPTRTVWTLVR